MGVGRISKELIFRHGSDEMRAELKVFNRPESVTRTPFFEIIMVIMISKFKILKSL